MPYSQALGTTLEGAVSSTIALKHTFPNINQNEDLTAVQMLRKKTPLFIINVWFAISGGLHNVQRRDRSVENYSKEDVKLKYIAAVQKMRSGRLRQRNLKLVNQPR